MVMRQRSDLAQTTRPKVLVGPVYQDFQPTFQWKQEEEFRLLTLYLPGFTRQQAQVAIENTNTIRVHGERRLAGSTYRRFNQIFRIPEGCSDTGIQASFANGLLSVKFLKKKIITPQEQPKPTQGTAPSSSTTFPDDERDGKISQLPTPQEPPVQPKPASSSGNGGDVKQTTLTNLEGKSQTEEAKVQEAVSKDESTNLKETTTSTIADKIPKEAKSTDKVDGTDLQQAKITDVDNVDKGGKNVVEEGIEGKETTETNESDKTVGKAVDDKETESGEKIAKDTVADKKSSGDKEKEKEKIDGSETGLDQYVTCEKNYSPMNKERRSKNGDDGFTFAKYKQIVKEFVTPRDDEERKLLVNMGVAALVIVALGAYITYINWPSRKPEN